MENLAKHAEKKVNEGLEVADEAIAEARAKSQSLWKKTKSTGQDLQNFVEKRPWSALGIALVTGVVIGALLVPKGRD